MLPTPSVAVLLTLSVAPGASTRLPALNRTDRADTLIDPGLNAAVEAALELSGTSLVSGRIAVIDSDAVPAAKDARPELCSEIDPGWIVLVVTSTMPPWSSCDPP